MKATVDANILFAALIADGTTRRIWFNGEIELYAPAFLVQELLKYRKMIESKTAEPGALDALLELVLKQVKLVPSEELAPYLPAAKTLTRDAKDWLYIACALKENTIIWSHDAEMKKQHRIPIRSTKELMDEIGTL